MSAWTNTFHWIECDRDSPTGGCDARTPLVTVQHVDATWAKAEKAGWRMVDGFHLCPAHAPELPALKRLLDAEVDRG